MKRVMLFVLAVMAVLSWAGVGEGEAQQSPSSHGAHPSGGGGAITNAKPGDFQFYLVTLSWSPEFCRTHGGGAHAAECAAPKGFVLHGLWPENFNGGYPDTCGTAPGPTDEPNFADIYPDRTFLEHEWAAHGTCSGLAPDAFFQAARKADQSIKIPSILKVSGMSGQMKTANIVAAFQQANPDAPAGAVVLGCAQNRLVQVQVCFDKDLNKIACQGLHSCGASSIAVTAPSH